MSLRDTVTPAIDAAPFVDTINGHPCVSATLTIAPGGWSRHRSVVSDSAEWCAYLFRLLEGEQVSVRIYSPTNFCAKTSTEQLTRCIEKARNEWEDCYLGEYFESEMARFIERFGDGTLSFTVGLSDVSESPEHLKELCKLLG